MIVMHALAPTARIANGPCGLHGKMELRTTWLIVQSCRCTVSYKLKISDQIYLNWLKRIATNTID